MCASPVSLSGCAADHRWTVRHSCRGPTPRCRPHRSRSSAAYQAGRPERGQLLLRRATSGSGPQEGPAGPASPELEARKADFYSACKTLIAELGGLDFSRGELDRYLRLTQETPRGIPASFPMSRCADVVALVGAGAGADDVADTQALQAAQLMLQELWRWRRRGGGRSDEVNVAPHVAALLELNRAPPESIEQITSSLLDNLPITDSEKREIGGAVEQVAIASIGSFIWGGIAFTVGFLVFFNFFLRS